MKKWFFILALAGAAEARVAFLETFTAAGQTQRFEEGFPYTHVALEVGDQWLHSYPGRGVELIEFEELAKLGKIREYLPVPASSVMDGEEQAYLGKPYDSVYAWSDVAFYCSELLGKILGIAPLPMHFDARLWPPSVLKWEGDWGVSPSLIYRWLSQRHGAANHDVLEN